MNTTGTLRIFLVDDDPFCLNLYAQHLSNAGYDDVRLFESGTDCLNALTYNPTVIFLDHSMPPLNGVEVLKKIKRFNPDIFVVFLSGQDDIGTAVNSLKFGAFDYIVKGAQDQEHIERALAKIIMVRATLAKSKGGLVRKMRSLIQ